MCIVYSFLSLHFFFLYILGVMRRQGRLSIVERVCFLLSDIFLIAKQLDKTGEKLELKQRVDLAGLMVDMRPSSCQKQELAKTKLAFPFRLISRSPQPTTYILGVSSIAEKQQWSRSFMLAITRMMYINKDERCNTFGWYLRCVDGTPQLAVLTGDMPLLQAILQEDPSAINQADQEGRTCLHIAAHADQSELISDLIACDADIKMRDGEGNTSIHIAAKMGHIRTLEALLHIKGVEISIWHPITKGEEKEGQKKGSNLKKESALWMCVLSQTKQWEACFHLLLQAATDSGISAVKLLDQRDNQGHNLLEECILSDLSSAIPVLLSAGASHDIPDSQGITPLGHAASVSDLDIMELLLGRGSQVTFRSLPSFTSPLHYAASVDSAALLIAHGARPLLPDREGKHIYNSSLAQEGQPIFQQAESSWRARPILITHDTMRQQPRIIYHSATGKPIHPRDIQSCQLCRVKFGPSSSSAAATTDRRREWCRRCGIHICVGCAAKRLAFRDTEIKQEHGKKEEENEKEVEEEEEEDEDDDDVRMKGKSRRGASSHSSEPVLATGNVCAGCYNTILYRMPRKRKQRANYDDPSPRDLEEGAEYRGPVSEDVSVGVNDRSSSAAAPAKEESRLEKLTRLITQVSIVPPPAMPPNMIRTTQGMVITQEPVRRTNQRQQVRHI